MPNNKGLILTITIIFVLILVIMAGVALVLMTNHTRVTESQVRRIRTYYAEEAALTKAYDELRTGTGIAASPFPSSPSSPRFYSNYLSLNNPATTVDLCIVDRGGPVSTNCPACPGSATVPPEYCVTAKATY